ncbi:MAG: hypothetical protein M1368_10430, partial [Thaumarchaeota archaeon]|nr:hypothetical protein [Nitrososphaerota archaeon]
EDAASLEVLCFDKTGTITQNRLSVADPIPSPWLLLDFAIDTYSKLENSYLRGLFAEDLTINTA